MTAVNMLASKSLIRACTAIEASVAKKSISGVVSKEIRAPRSIPEPGKISRRSCAVSASVTPSFKKPSDKSAPAGNVTSPPTCNKGAKLNVSMCNARSSSTSPVKFVSVESSKDMNCMLLPSNSKSNGSALPGSAVASICVKSATTSTSGRLICTSTLFPAVAVKVITSRPSIWTSSRMTPKSFPPAPPRPRTLDTIRSNSTRASEVLTPPKSAEARKPSTSAPTVPSRRFAIVNNSSICSAVSAAM